MAQDVWSLGYLIYWLLTQRIYFTTTKGTWEAVCQKQDTWVSMARQLDVQAVVIGACVSATCIHAAAAPMMHIN